MVERKYHVKIADNKTNKVFLEFKFTCTKIENFNIFQKMGLQDVEETLYVDRETFKTNVKLFKSFFKTIDNKK